jgi:hypothetical protein
MAAHVERVLVAFCLVLVLETVAAERALVLLFSLVSASHQSASDSFIVNIVSRSLIESGSVEIKMRSNLLEFLKRLEPLGLLGAALAHEKALDLGSAWLLHFSDLTCARTRDGPRVDGPPARNGGSRAWVERNGGCIRRVARCG